MLPSWFARTPTLTPHTFAAMLSATPTGTVTVVVLLFSRLVTVTLTSPPVTTGCADAAGMPTPKAIALAANRLAHALRTIRYLSSSGSGPGRRATGTSARYPWTEDGNTPRKTEMGTHAAPVPTPFQWHDKPQEGASPMKI